jgi:hypothetical protein
VTVSSAALAAVSSCRQSRCISVLVPSAAVHDSLLHTMSKEGSGNVLLLLSDTFIARRGFIS